MKKIFCLILMSLFLLSSVGCEGNTDIQDNNSGLIKLTDLNMQLEEQIKITKSKEYPNIVFDDNLRVSVPNVDKVYDLKLTAKASLGAKDCFLLFDSYFDSLFSDVYNDEDKKSLYHFRPAGDDYNRLVDNSKPYPHNYPLFYDYMNEVLDGNIGINEFCVDVDKAYLEVFANGQVYAFSLGKARALYNPVAPGKNIGFWNPAWDIEEYTASYTDFSADISYRLRDKETSIKEAAETAERLVTDGGCGGGTQLRLKAAEVSAVDLEDGYYGYIILLSNAYKGVNFLVALGGSGLGYSGNSYGINYSQMPGSIFMLESGEIDSMVGYNSAFDVEELEEYDRVISFENAVQLLSDTFSSSMKFNIKSAELMYAKYPTVSDSEDEFKSDIIWCFLTESTGDARRYKIYINALDGSCSYFVE